MSVKKIIAQQELGAIAHALRKGGKRMVTTNGVFDILHRGHVTYLQEAKKLGDVLIVGINSDASVKKIKGPDRPINKEQDRAFCVAALGCVDYVFVFPEENPIGWLNELKPDIHVKGGDYRGKESKIVEKETVEKNGGKIVLVDMVDGYSTTALIREICK